MGFGLYETKRNYIPACRQLGVFCFTGIWTRAKTFKNLCELTSSQDLLITSIPFTCLECWFSKCFHKHFLILFPLWPVKEQHCVSELEEAASRWPSVTLTILKLHVPVAQSRWRTGHCLFPGVSWQASVHTAHKTLGAEKFPSTLPLYSCWLRGC